MIGRRLTIYLSKLFVGAIFICIILHFTVQREVSVKHGKWAKSYTFDEKSIYDGKKVEFYSTQDLLPAVIRPNFDHKYPGKGGEPVILTNAGTF